jgi:endo-1,4-beta-xylanase
VGFLLICYAHTARAQTQGLKDILAGHHKYIGVAVSRAHIDCAGDYFDLIKREFNAVGAENCFKFCFIQPEPGCFQFEVMDHFVNRAAECGMRVRMHVMIWHQQLPAWLDTGTFDRDALLAIMKEHITTIMERYQGRIAEYDIVNEAWDETKGGCMRQSLWYRIIGPEYIDSAFCFARRADPQALLYYNDYDAEGMNAKSDSIFSMVQEMKQKGIPVDGIGFQCHFPCGKIPESMEQNIDRLDSLGLKVAFTEVDVALDSAKCNPEGYYQQANDYRKLAALFLRKKTCETFMTWGLSDNESWIPNFYHNTKGDALLFDRNYKPKPAYEAIKTTWTKEANQQEDL